MTQIVSKQLHQKPRSESSKHDDWWTPWKLFFFLCEYFRFQPIIDVCATKKSSKCVHYFTQKDNALTKNWKLRHIKKHDVWCNPPNSVQGKFLRKAYEEFKKGGIRIMMIIPANVVSSDAWKESVEDPIDNGEKVFYKSIHKRQKFLEHGKEPESSARNAYMVVIWGRRPRF